MSQSLGNSSHSFFVWSIGMDLKKTRGIHPKPYKAAPRSYQRFFLLQHRNDSIYSWSYTVTVWHERHAVTIRQARFQVRGATLKIVVIYHRHATLSIVFRQFIWILWKRFDIQSDTYFFILHYSLSRLCTRWYQSPHITAFRWHLHRLYV